MQVVRIEILKDKVDGSNDLTQLRLAINLLVQFQNMLYFHHEFRAACDWLEVLTERHPPELMVCQQTTQAYVPRFVLQ